MAIARGEYTITELYDGDNFYRAWADSDDGSVRFSTTESDRLYMGTYVGLTRPSSPSQYTWSKIVGESAVIGALSNDTHQIGTNRDGEEGNYHGANTTLTIFRGGVEETNDWDISLDIDPKDSVEGTFSDHTYTVTKLKTDEATITFTAEHKTRKNDSLITKVFSLSKNKQGIDGKDAKGYFLSFNDTSIRKNRVTNEILPENLIIGGYSVTGEAEPVPASGYFKVFTQSEISVGRDEYEQAYINGLLDPEEYYVLSDDNYPLMLAYESKEAEDELIYGVTQLIELMSVKVYWYKDSEFKHLLDMQTVHITSDGIDGEQGPKGDTGTSVSSVVEWYLATNLSDGVTTSTDGWTTAMQPITVTKKYLWNYEVINFSDGSSSPTVPVIIGAYGNTGATGRALTGITEYYLASASASGVKRPTTDGTNGWTTTMQSTSISKPYLWNYEKLSWSATPTTTYIDPIIIGVHGPQGPQGPKGEQGEQGPEGENATIISPTEPKDKTKLWRKSADSPEFYMYVNGEWKVYDSRLEDIVQSVKDTIEEQPTQWQGDIDTNVQNVIGRLTEMQTELSDIHNELTGKANQEETLNSEEIENIINEVLERYPDLLSLKQHFRFDSENGISMSATDASNQALETSFNIKNDGARIYVNGAVVAYFTETETLTSDLNVERTAYLGNHAITRFNGYENNVYDENKNITVFAWAPRKVED